MNDEQSIPELPDFELLRPIGRGGFGQVWLAKNRATGQLRAVKVIPLHRLGTADPAGREIASITRLEENVRTHHPSLLGIHHVGKTDQWLFYVMDPADDVTGCSASSDSSYRPATLHSRLQQRALLAEECLDYARQLLGGLAALHEAGMVHRDVKPANCLFVGGRLKLADFGLLTEASTQISRLGTQKYMPPDGRMDIRADVYAAGLVIYEMITGLPAESFPRLGERAAAMASDQDLGRLNRVVLRGCQPDPAHRFADAGKMLAALETTPRKSLPHLRKPRLRSVVALGCLLVAFSLTAAGLSSKQRRKVDVNFISEPYFEATIYLDDRPQLREDGQPHRTPCTISNLPARVHHTVFKRDGLNDLDAGTVDFAKTREVIAQWDSGR